MHQSNFPYKIFLCLSLLALPVCFWPVFFSPLPTSNNYSFFDASDSSFQASGLACLIVVIPSLLNAFLVLGIEIHKNLFFSSQSQSHETRSAHVSGNVLRVTLTASECNSQNTLKERKIYHHITWRQ